ncbi:MAG: type II toxin-antitoxin system RelE/ParE family toxin [Synergistaceae bacterium]|jgi:mRNA interferase RelE/StbE|nr:type II toxin-antitoxin system RelE/ParE family toxin [Synergistaceae bacterium]
MAHSIEFKPCVDRELDLLPREVRAHIVKAVMALADTPRPVGCKKLKGRDAWRIRVGNYRVIYEIHDNILVVLVVRVARRREAYKA